MPGMTIGEKLNYGYPGTFSRQNIQLQISRPAGGTIPFGAPVKINGSGKYVRMGAGAAAADFAGIAARVVKQAASFATENKGEFVENDIATVINQGAVSVECNVGTPAVNGKVYLRITANAAIPAGVVGGLEAQADGANTVQLTNAAWNIDGKDANNVSEIRILYPVTA